MLRSNSTFTDADAGKVSFAVTLDTAGTQSITATDTTSSSITGSESGIAVQAAAAETLALTGFATSDTAGTTGDMTITAYDAYGNVATGYTGTVDLMSTDPHAALPSSETFTVAGAGKLSFAVTLDTAGTQSITATDSASPSITGTESGIAVQAAAANTLVLTGFPTSDTAGAERHLDNHGLRRLWQPGDRLHGHGGSDEHRPPRRVTIERHLHRRRRGQAEPLRDPRYGRHTVDHRD